MIYIPEHVHFYHPFLKDLTSLSHTHQWMESAPFKSSLKLHLQNAFFCLRHIQCFSEYHSNQSFRKSLSKFTTYIPGMVQKKMAKTAIRLNKSEVPIYSRNKINPRKKICCKILVWRTKINIYHSKNDQKLLSPCFLLMGINGLQIIPFCWNRWHPHGNT